MQCILVATFRKKRAATTISVATLGNTSLNLADFNLHRGTEVILQISKSLGVFSHPKDKPRYLNAVVSCACELIVLFCVVFYMVIDGYEFDFGFIMN